MSASLAGCALRLTSVSIAGGEVLVAASVVAAGVLLAVDRKVRHSLLVVSLALAGVFHGFVYGESIAGTEPTSIVGYLLGLGVIQYALAMAAFVVTKRFSDRALPQRNVLMRTAGIAVGLVGMVSFALTI